MLYRGWGAGMGSFFIWTGEGIVIDFPCVVTALGEEYHECCVFVDFLIIKTHLFVFYVHTHMYVHTN